MLPTSAHNRDHLHSVDVRCLSSNADLTAKCFLGVSIRKCGEIAHVNKLLEILEILFYNWKLAAPTHFDRQSLCVWFGPGEVAQKAPGLLAAAGTVTASQVVPGPLSSHASFTCTQTSEVHSCKPVTT